MLKFGTPTIALPLAIKKCTVQTRCTVHIIGIFLICKCEFVSFYTTATLELKVKILDQSVYLEALTSSDSRCMRHPP